MSSQNEVFAKRFPEKVGHVGTHYPSCFKSHPSCAWRVGWEDGVSDVSDLAGLAEATIEKLRDEVVALRRERDEARSVAAGLGEQLHAAERERDEARADATRMRLLCDEASDMRDLFRDKGFGRMLDHIDAYRATQEDA